MMSGNYLYNLNGNLNRLSKLLEQESTGKAINGISDDPVRTTQSLAARNRLSAVGRYQTNIKQADSWLTEIEESVSVLNDIMGDAYELSVSASSDTLNDSDLKAMAEEIASLRDEVLTTANATCGDSYLFAGYNTTGTSTGALPYTVDSNGDLYYNGIKSCSSAG
jgi:flagellar hook-associated protein 3 FlgL